MLTAEEQKFVSFWAQNRLRKKKVWRQLSVGLPMAVVLVTAILVNLFSGWDKRAQMIVNTDPSIIIVLLVAVILIVIFISIFSVRHKWDLNEQRYRELVSRKGEGRL